MMLVYSEAILALLYRPIAYPYEAILIVSLLYRTFSLWDKQKRIKSIALLALTVCIVAVLKHLLSWIAELNTESFYEIVAPDSQQAIFYFENLIVFIANSFSIKKTIILLIFYGVIALSIKYLNQMISDKYDIMILNKMTIAFFKLLFIFSLLWHPAKTWSEARSLESKIKEVILDQAPFNLQPKNRNIKTLVYIGESTSSMHMSLYGYPRSTNPELQKILDSEETLLIFKNVFSTHTHTTWSLLEALTFKLDLSPIGSSKNSRKAIFFGNLFEPLISTSVLSSQSMTGSWSLGQHVLFADTPYISTYKNLPIGNNWMNEPRNDRKLIAGVRQWTQEISSNILIAHSITGHGPYDLYVSPEFSERKIDSFYQNLENPQAIFGSLTSNLTSSRAIDNLENYDLAMLEVDSNIADNIASIRSNPDPSVMIYFSDHGESVFTQSGHDSSKFQFEMITVPLIIYTNNAFREQYPTLQNELVKLKELSLHTPLTLRIIPHLLALIYGGNLPSQYRYQEQEHGQSIPIMKTIINQEGSPEIIDLSPNINSTNTQIEILKSKLIQSQTNLEIGYHRANSVASAIRGSCVADFIECDIVIEPDDIFVYHPPADNKQLRLSTIIQIAHAYHRGLWLDLKNLNDEYQFELLYNYLKRHKNIDRNSLFLELPSSSLNIILNSARVRAILRDWRIQGIRISYYMPYEDLEKHRTEKSDVTTLHIIELVNKINSIDALSDISFDHRYEAIIKSLPIHPKLAWNTWNVEAKNIKLLDKTKYRKVIAITKDPNSN